MLNTEAYSPLNVFYSEWFQERLETQMSNYHKYVEDVAKGKEDNLENMARTPGKEGRLIDPD